MCIHKLYIFTCQHTFFSPTPLLRCPQSTQSSTTTIPSPCPAQTTHPFHTRSLPTPCRTCHLALARRTQRAESLKRRVSVAEAKWRVTYGARQGEREAWKTWGEEPYAGHGWARSAAGAEVVGTQLEGSECEGEGGLRRRVSWRSSGTRGAASVGGGERSLPTTPETLKMPKSPGNWVTGIWG
jgi:hypothetical protein